MKVSDSSIIIEMVLDAPDGSMPCTGGATGFTDVPGPRSQIRLTHVGTGIHVSHKQVQRNIKAGRAQRQ